MKPPNLSTILLICIGTLLPACRDGKGRPSPEDLRWASESGDMAAIQRYIAAGGDINIPFDTHKGLSGGQTALHLACLGGHLSVVEELVKAGANVNAADGLGRTPMHAAIGNSSSSAPILEVLLNSGAKPTQSDRDGVTCLMEAAHIGDLEGVRILIQNTRTLDLQDKTGMTALHWTITQSQSKEWKDVARLLLQAGANPNLTDARGLSFAADPRIQDQADLIALVKK